MKQVNPRISLPDLFYINPFKPNVPIIQKLVNGFALLVDGGISPIWANSASIYFHFLHFQVFFFIFFQSNSKGGVLAENGRRFPY